MGTIWLVPAQFRTCQFDISRGLAQLWSSPAQPVPPTHSGAAAAAVHRDLPQIAGRGAEKKRSPSQHPPALRARQPAMMSGSSWATCSGPCTASTSARPCARQGGAKRFWCLEASTGGRACTPPIANRPCASRQSHHKCRKGGSENQVCSDSTARTSMARPRSLQPTLPARRSNRLNRTCAAPERSTAEASDRSFSSSQGTTPPSWSSPMSAHIGQPKADPSVNRTLQQKVVIGQKNS